jgi:3-oxoacyl-[acyl-carrier protein] reductase
MNAPGAFTSIPREFEGQVVLVTGGSRGIGRAIVERFAAQGARVFFTYHQSHDQAAALAAESKAKAIHCSQSDSAAIAAALADVLAASGRIDVLVNNAGITRDAFLMLMPPEDWMRCSTRT